MSSTVSTRSRSLAARPAQPGRSDTAHLRRETLANGDFGGALVGWAGRDLPEIVHPPPEFMRRYAPHGRRAGEFQSCFNRTRLGKTFQKSSTARLIGMRPPWVGARPAQLEISR